MDNSRDILKIPNTNKPNQITESQLKHNFSLKKSLDSGYLSKQEFLCGLLVKSFCDLNIDDTYLRNSEPIDFDLWFDEWKQNLPDAFEYASKTFKISEEKAKESYKKFSDYRVYFLKN